MIFLKSLSGRVDTLSSNGRSAVCGRCVRAAHVVLMGCVVLLASRLCRSPEEVTRSGRPDGFTSLGDFLLTVTLFHWSGGTISVSELGVSCRATGWGEVVAPLPPPPSKPNLGVWSRRPKCHGGSTRDIKDKAITLAVSGEHEFYQSNQLAL